MSSKLGVQNIAHTNGTNAMTIASDGVVTQPNNPMFKVSGANNIAITNNTRTKITFNSVEFDVGGYFDATTNYRYTPQVAGKYFINARAYITYASAGIENIYGYIYKNGSSVAQFQSIAGGINYGTVYVSSLIDMNGSTDYLEMYLMASVSTDAAYYAGGDIGEFSGYRVGG